MAFLFHREKRQPRTAVKETPSGGKEQARRAPTAFAVHTPPDTNKGKQAAILTLTAETAEKLRRGVALINDQHKRIFNYTTDLFAHCIGDEEKESEYFGSSIEAAAKLVVTHFKTEEDLMMATNFYFDALAAHKREHREFVETVVSYMNDFKATGSINLLMFASYAKWWVINHIKRFDNEYIAYFNKIAEGYNIAKMHA
jgi:hemerythrin-like metal-binding protein